MYSGSTYKQLKYKRKFEVIFLTIQQILLKVFHGWDSITRIVEPDGQNIRF